MENTERKEVCEALCESSLAYSIDGNNVTINITREYDIINMITLCDGLSRKIIHSNEELFSVKTNVRNGVKYVPKTKLLGTLAMLFNINFEETRNHYPMYESNPYVGLFIKVATEIGLLDYVKMAPCLTNEKAVQCVEALNKFVDAMRIEGRNSNFKTKISNFTRNANERYQELQRYIKALFDRYSRLLVLRIDFGYKKESGWPNGTATNISYGEFKKHRAKLVRSLPTGLPPDSLRGYAWKLENGLEKGYHIHVLIFLDGSKVQEDVTIARIIGERWNNEITEGKGLYFNCNAKKSGYRSCGIGMVSHWDAAMLEGLRKAALYMTKPDFYIRMVTPDGGRTFGKGIMPEPKTSNRGRPRAKIALEKKSAGQSPKRLASGPKSTRKLVPGRL